MPLVYGTDLQTVIQGTDAVASVTVIVTDDKAVELGREVITASVNASLSATDPARRGLKVDAADRLRDLLAAEAERVGARIAAENAPLAKFADLATTLKATEADVSASVDSAYATAKAVALEGADI